MLKSVSTPAALLAGAALALATAMPATAESPDNSALNVSAQTVSANAALARFAPATDRIDHRIDYEHWDEALQWFVIPMGPPLRERARTIEPRLGSRIVYGHQSRFRLEGNRIAFSMLTPDVLQALTDYRKDLERVGTELDLARLPRNEQLAYWLNLHNVAVIEALAHEYPLRTPAERTFGANEAGLQDAKLVTVKGVALSPRDIREGIVYPNWEDPKVIYGFWRGEIGGPSIQRLAYTGANVDVLLSFGAEEFVNSLRGVEAWGGRLRLSRIFDEARPFFFPDDRDLRDHLNQYAREEVRDLVRENRGIAYTNYDGDIADLLFGKGDPGYDALCTMRGGAVGGYDLAANQNGCWIEGTVPDRAAVRLMEERATKLYRAWKRGIRTGMVIFGDGYAEGEEPKEVQ